MGGNIISYPMGTFCSRYKNNGRNSSKKEILILTKSDIFKIQTDTNHTIHFYSIVFSLSFFLYFVNYTCDLCLAGALGEWNGLRTHKTQTSKERFFLLTPGTGMV